MARKGVYIKFLEKGNEALHGNYRFPKRIYRGYTTERIEPIILCRSGWHFVKADNIGIKRFCQSGRKCFAVIPVGHFIGNHIRDNKHCCSQLIFIGQIKVNQVQWDWSKAYKDKIKKRNESIIAQATKLTNEWNKKHKKGGK